MEPLAPGTEDDVQHYQHPASKKTTEQERLLAIKAYLPSGEYGNVFELTYNNGSDHWYCKVCKCPIMGRVFYHEGGKRHSLNMSLAQSKRPEKIPEIEPENNVGDHLSSTIRVAPGEPVPPGFEGEITKVAQIQERLDSFRSGALLGLEYLLEIQDYDQDKEPSYLCLLCGKKGDPRTVITHLVSYNHLQGYLQRHFPKTYQALAPYVTRQYKKNWRDTMNKIAEAIENKYGRLLPHPVDAETFDRKKDDLYQMVYAGPHFSEKNGVTFEYLVDKETITKLTEEEPKIPPPTIPKKRSPSPPVVKKPKKPRPSGVRGRRRSLSSVSSISSSDLSDFNDKFDDKRQKFKKRPDLDRKRRFRSGSRSPRSRATYSRRSPSPNRFQPKRYESTYYNRRDRSKSKERHNEKIEEYRKLSLAIENDMERVLKQHKINPEKHPKYNEEWKKFWNKRYKELQAEGKDASKYDFKPEWIVYWNEKIVELHRAEVKDKLDALKRRLSLPVEPSPVSFKIGGKKKNDLSDPSKPPPMASQPDQDHEIIVIDDDVSSPLCNRSPWQGGETSHRKRADDRLSLERVSSPEREPRSPSFRRRSPSCERFRSRERRSRERGYIREHSTERTRYRSRDRVRSREKSWERDINFHRESRKDPIHDIYKPPPVIRDVTRHPVDYTIASQPEIEDGGDINIVAVLRILTALEDKLGSLGPKVIDMLATALAMEKKEANSSETLLDNEMNCVLFETVKEKLKGALHAGLVGYNQEKAFKIAVKKIASLMHLANQRKNEIPGKSAKEPVKVPGVGTVDKAAIAKQIATALILQGKTDVTQAELEQLIDAVVGMAEASKNSDKPITTATFLETLSTKKADTPQTTLQKEESYDKPKTSTAISENDFIKEKSSDAMDGLSDSDLQTLLQNFKDLSPEEQHGLITYLRKLESKEPERVEKLRKFVDLGQENKESGRISPFSMKLQNNEKSLPMKHNSTLDDFEDDVPFEQEEKIEEAPSTSLKIDSDEEDYSYEDVFKAASKNVEENQKKPEPKHDEDVLTDAKALIANIMGSITAKTTPAPRIPEVADPQLIKPFELRSGQPINLNLISNIRNSPTFQTPNRFNSNQPNPGFNRFPLARPGAPAMNRPPQQNPPFLNQNFPPYGNNFNNNYPNHFNQGGRFQMQQRPQFGPGNHRGGGSFNNGRW